MLVSTGASILSNSFVTFVDTSDISDIYVKVPRPFLEIFSSK